MAEPKEPTPKHDTILVPMWGVESARGEVVLETRNLGPCVGIAIYEPQSLTGFLAHIPNPELPGSEYYNLEGRLIQEFIRTPAVFENMRAWLAGGKTIAGYEEHNQKMRQWVLDGLVLMGIPQEAISARWTGDEAVSAGMKLNCADGTCEIFYDNYTEDES